MFTKKDPDFWGDLRLDPLHGPIAKTTESLAVCTVISRFQIPIDLQVIDHLLAGDLLLDSIL